MVQGLGADTTFKGQKRAVKSWRGRNSLKCFALGSLKAVKSDNIEVGTI